LNDIRKEGSLVLSYALQKANIFLMPLKCRQIRNNDHNYWVVVVHGFNCKSNHHTALLPSHSSSQLNDGLPDEHFYVLKAELSQTLLGRPDAEVARVVETGQVVEGEL
jgi:hypothetical protein